MSIDPFLQDKTAMITGAASGLGRAIALALAQAGCRLLLTDIDEAAGAETRQQIQAEGGHAIFIPADVTNGAAVKEMTATGLAQLGRLDIAVNNAGIEGPLAPTAEYPANNWHRVLAVNLTGVWHCMQAQLPAMVDQQEGIVINVASVAGLVGFPDHAAYAASKHGVVGLTRTAALEYVRYGVRINALCPGFTDTPMLRNTLDDMPDYAARLRRAIPARRFGRPEEIASAALYLCRPEAAFMIGHTLVMDGGITAS